MLFLPRGSISRERLPLRAALSFCNSHCNYSLQNPSFFFWFIWFFWKKPAPYDVKTRRPSWNQGEALNCSPPDSTETTPQRSQARESWPLALCSTALASLSRRARHSVGACLRVKRVSDRLQSLASPAFGGYAG
jgi:hypothetical protein